MIHDAYGEIITKSSNMVKINYSSIHSIIYYINLLKKRTKLSEKEINEFIERDIYINSEYCLNKGIVDRILYLPKINIPNYYSNFSNLQLNLSNFLKKTNLNHIYISEDIYNNNSKVVNLNNWKN
jgi:hypothetical protein